MYVRVWLILLSMSLGSIHGEAMCQNSVQSLLFKIIYWDYWLTHSHTIFFNSLVAVVFGSLTILHAHTHSGNAGDWASGLMHVDQVLCHHALCAQGLLTCTTVDLKYLFGLTKFLLTFIFLLRMSYTCFFECQYFCWKLGILIIHCSNHRFWDFSW